MSVVDPAPAQLADVLTPDWLTAALCGLQEGEKVVEAQVVDDYTTVLSKVRIKIVVEGRDGRTTTRRYCVKGAFATGATAQVETEGRFYRELAQSIGVRVPDCQYAGANGETGRSLFIMSDLTSEGATFLNSQFAYTPELSVAVLGQLALLHARTWGDERYLGLDWLADNGPRIADAVPVDLVQRLINDGRADGLPDYLRDAERIKAAMQKVSSPERVCVVHGDPHSLNIYLDREGRPGLLDWQMVHTGHWATDVSYHIATAFDVEARRRNEESLLRCYLDELARHGQEPPSWEEAWDQYTLRFAYGYYYWCLAQVTPRADIVEHIPRLGAALHDHDTFRRLGV